MDDTTPQGDVTPETFLSVSKQSNVAGDYREGEATYTLPQDQAADTVAFGGTWTTDYQGATAGADAALRLRYHAKVVQVVLGGSGSVRATVRDEDGQVVDRVRGGCRRLAARIPAGQRPIPSAAGPSSWRSRRASRRSRSRSGDRPRGVCRNYR